MYADAVRVVTMSIISFSAGSRTVVAAAVGEERAAATDPRQIWLWSCRLAIELDLRGVESREACGRPPSRESTYWRKSSRSGRLGLGRQQVEPQPGGADRIGLVDDLIAPSSNRSAAPEKVKAISRPSSANTAPSTAPVPTRAPSGIALQVPGSPPPAQLQAHQAAREQAQGGPGSARERGDPIALHGLTRPNATQGRSLAAAM
jgi:hypothetical protein